MSSSNSRRRLDAALATLFGSEIDWRRETGLLQVTAIDARARSVIAIGPDAPASATDRFVLGFARARADAIVTTGAILRAEPDVVHRFSDDAREDAAWRDWRADRIGRREPPSLLILTRSGELPLGHPAFVSGARTIVWTSEAGRARLARAGDPLELVVGIGAPPETAPSTDHERGVESPAAALSAAYRWLRDEVGAETVTVEAGARATQGLYDMPPAAFATAASTADASYPIAPLDELLLSLYAGELPSAVAGLPLPSPALLAAYFSRVDGSKAGDAVTQPKTRVRVEESSGAWLFERYRRAD